MLIRIFGLTSSPVCWKTNRQPLAGGRELVLALQAALKTGDQLKFFVNDLPLAQYCLSDLRRLSSGQPLEVIAKPETARHFASTGSRLYLVTETGPDAGRSVPLSRRSTTVGRAGASIQVRDPWLSGQAFQVGLTHNGIEILEHSGDQILLEPFGDVVSGATRFCFHRGAGEQLRPPYDPGSFRVTTPSPPTRPNMVLQIIGAAAPLIIGIVLMLMTGMWYFLLFSGISVIIAIVLIWQYRRARARFIGLIRKAVTEAQHRRRRAMLRPSQFVAALSSRHPDPFGYQAQQPDVPLLNLGTAVFEATLESVEDAEQWRSYLSGRTEVVLRLAPGSTTVITGDAARRLPLKNWCAIQILRHAQASQTGVKIDGEILGGIPLVTITDRLATERDLQTHQLVFCQQVPSGLSEDVTVIDLDTLTITGDESGTNFEALGISSQTLSLLRAAMNVDVPAFGGHEQELVASGEQPWSSSIMSLVTSLGHGPSGITIDLVQDGPHVLITGTTGSGKSELLLTLLAGLVSHHPPGEVGLILLDFKGGSSFNVFASLPHTMSMETNHVAAHSLRSLTAIEAELLRREALFAQHQVPDYMTFRRKHPQYVLPRLVVAIDELRVLVEQHEEAASTLAHLAATGRSLGFHVVMATQRSQGAVTSDIKANIGSIIALRTATEHDSWDVLATADAYRIAVEHPGRAFFKSGAANPVEFQTARYVLASEPLMLRPLDGEQRVKPQPTDWHALAKHITEVFKTAPRPEPVLLPALPSFLTPSSLSGGIKYQGDSVLGLADDPTQCLQYPVSLSAEQVETGELGMLCRSMGFIGVADSGIEDALGIVLNHVCSLTSHSVFLDGRAIPAQCPGVNRYVHRQDSSAEMLEDQFRWLAAQLAQQNELNLVISDWGSWQNASVAGSYQVFEELVANLLRQYPQTLRLYVFGGRELASGRLIGQIPDRLYLPKHVSAEHQLLWPKLRTVPTLRGRGILVTAEVPTGGTELQLISGS